MKRSLLAFSAAIVIGLTSMVQAQNDTLEKIKTTGEITLGVRESSIGLAYAIGNGKYTGFHTEMAEYIIDDISKKLVNQLKSIIFLSRHKIEFLCYKTEPMISNVVLQQMILLAIKRLRLLIPLMLKKFELL